MDGNDNEWRRVTTVCSFSKKNAHSSAVSCINVFTSMGGGLNAVDIILNINVSRHSLRFQSIRAMNHFAHWEKEKTPDARRHWRTRRRLRPFFTSARSEKKKCVYVMARQAAPVTASLSSDTLYVALSLSFERPIQNDCQHTHTHRCALYLVFGASRKKNNTSISFSSRVGRKNATERC